MNVRATERERERERESKWKVCVAVANMAAAVAVRDKTNYQPSSSFFTIHCVVYFVSYDLLLENKTKLPCPVKKNMTKY